MMLSGACGTADLRVEKHTTGTWVVVRNRSDHFIEQGALDGVFGEAEYSGNTHMKVCWVGNTGVSPCYGCRWAMSITHRVGRRSPWARLLDISPHGGRTTGAPAPLPRR